MEIRDRVPVPGCLGGNVRLGLLRTLVVVVVAVPAFGGPVSVNLGTAISFGMLGGTVSNTGSSVVMGNVGVKNAAGTITGFPPGTTVGGHVSAPGATDSTNAYIDFVNAFNTALLLSPTQSYNDLTMSRTFIGNNVYDFTLTNISTTTGINLTFDAQNNSNEVFVVRVAGAFTANGILTFTLANQAQASNIYWIIGTDATISPASSAPMTFDGDILAGSSFTMSAATGGSGTLAGTINGCVYAETANTLAGFTKINGCSASSVPEPGSFGLVALGCLLGALSLASSDRSARLGERKKYS